MFRPLQIFDGPILDPNQFLYATETFAQRSLYRYQCYDTNGQDLHEDLPIAVDHGESYMLVYLLGLIKPARPNHKAILQGMARIRGYVDLIHTAYEPLRKDPLAMTAPERIAALNNLKRRLRHSIVILAGNAGLTPFEPNQEVDNAEMVQGFSDPTS